MNNIVDGRKVSLCSMLFILSSRATVLKQIMGTHVHTKNIEWIGIGIPM